VLCAETWGRERSPLTKHARPRTEPCAEYVGDVISENESNRRGQIYDQGFRNYQFDLNFTQSVDAYRRGNDSRFINQPDQEFRRRDREPTGETGEANCYPRGAPTEPSSQVAA
jgi:hypothetical protein